MTRSGPAYAKLQDKSHADLEEMLATLTELLQAKYPPVGDRKTEDLYVNLPPHVKEWLASASKEKLASIDSMVVDYNSAQSVGKFIKLFFYALGGIVGATFTVVKGAPDVLDWLRKVLMK